MKNVICIIFVIITLFILSCSNIEIKKDYLNKVDFDYNEFETNVNKWKNLNIKNYSFHFYSKEFSLFDLSIDVSNDQVLKVVKNDVESLDESHDIDSLISRIKYVYKKNHDEKFNKNHNYFITKIDLTYDAIYFFPISYKETLYMPANQTFKGNSSWEISNFINKN